MAMTHFVSIAITITARICIAPPTALDGSASQAEKLRLKYNIKY